MSKIAIVKFLQNCIEYADASMQRKKERGDDPSIISEWEAYRNYTQYALEEVEKGDLDHWLKREYSTAINEIDIEELDHPTRAKWLSAAVSPRPLALISTRNDERENVAPMTSLSVVSNTPPLIVMSLSQDRNGKQRDTYLNLKENGICEIQLMAPTMQAAKDVDIVSKATDESEWNLIESEGPIHDLAVIVLRCRMVRDDDLPEGAVARLVTLRVESIITPEYLPPEDGFSILCQHGMDRLTPSPIDWGHLATHHRS
ncbi:MAG: flavin reductase [Candidatus Poseidoniaceae archaeon]